MHIYVLQLRGGKYYVGVSNNIELRFMEHLSGFGGAKWTELHEPLRVVETRPIRSPFCEDNVVKEYMNRYGVDNVRGGSYSNPILDTPSKTALNRELASVRGGCFRCGKPDHWVADCRRRQCFRCGRTSHYTQDCFATTHADGRRLL